MGRPKKDAKYLNVYIERSIYDEFTDLCDKLGQSKTVAAERALRCYMDNTKAQLKVSESKESEAVVK